MTPERWRQVEEIFHAALSRDESERVAFLADACASDLALRREVEVLLARQASGFLEGPVATAVGETISDAGDSLLTGRRLGSYQVHERIGVGGMGEVYRARDTKLGRIGSTISAANVPPAPLRPLIASRRVIARVS